jgi:hypothetical protein
VVFLAAKFQKDETSPGGASAMLGPAFPPQLSTVNPVVWRKKEGRPSKERAEEKKDGDLLWNDVKPHL